MKLKMSEGRFGAPEGTYIGRFLGVSPMKDSTPRLGRDGKPMEPGMEWQWEITEDSQNGGAYVGKIVGRITSQVATKGNAAGTLLRGLVGRAVDADEEIDPDHYRGQLYWLTIGPGKENPERTQVILVKPHKSPLGPPPAPQGAAPPPPPQRRANGPAAPTTPPVPQARRFWVMWEGAERPELYEEHALVATLSQKHLDPALIDACLEGGQEWKPLKDFGLSDPVPY